MLQHHFLSPIPQHHCYSSIRNYPLPLSYLTFLQQEGAGYFVRSFISTVEPTRFSMDGTLINGLFGFEASGDFLSIEDDGLAPKVTGLPEYFVPFFKDDSVYYCFDYKNSNSPSIRLVDVEMDQWLTIAPNFEMLLSQLSLHLEEIDYDSRTFLTKHTIQQQLGNFQEENFMELLELLEEEHLQEELQWIHEALHTKNLTIITLAKEKLEFLKEFRAQEIKSFL